MVGGRIRRLGWGSGAILGLLVATSATALQTAWRPSAHPWLVRTQADETTEPGTAARLRAVVEGIRKRLREQERRGDESPTSVAAPATTLPAPATLEAEIRAMRDRVVELARALAAARAERERLARQLEARDREIERLQQAVGTARVAAEARAAERLRDLEGRLAAAERAREELARELERTQQELTTRSQALAELRELRAKLEAKLSDTERQVEELTTSMKQAWDERNALERQLAAAREALAERQREFDRQLAAAQARIRKAEQEAARLREAGIAQNRQIGELEETVARLRKQVRDLIRENRELQAVATDSVSQLEEVSDRLFRALEEKERLARALAALRETERILQQQLTGVAAVAPAAGETSTPEEEQPAVRHVRAPTGRAGADTREAPSPAPDRAPETARVRETRVAVLQPPPDAEEDRGLEVTMSDDGWLRTILEGLEFEPGSAEPKPGFEAVLERAAALARLYPDGPIRIEGHTDSVGPAERNRILSLQRARRVRDLLVRRHGLDVRRIEVLGHGEDRPIASNDTPEGRARNRRIEMWIHPTGGPPPTAGGAPVN